MSINKKNIQVIKKITFEQFEWGRGNEALQSLNNTLGQKRTNNVSKAKQVKEKIEMEEHSTEM